MGKIVSLLLGFFGLAGPIANFFIMIGKKLTFKVGFLPIQFLIVGALFTAKLAFLVASIQIVITFYNAINSLLDYVYNLSIDSAFSVIFEIFNSMGVIQAFSDAFSIFSISFVSLLILYVTKYFIESLKLASDEFYKIGMLLQA